MCCTSHASCDVAGGTSFSFSSPELTHAGRYTVAAVFEESRPDLVRAIGKRDAVVRSAALELHVQPGPPATLLMLQQVRPSHLVAKSAAQQGHQVGEALIQLASPCRAGSFWYD